MINNIIIFGKKLYQGEDGYVNYGLYNALKSFDKYNIILIDNHNLSDFDNIGDNNLIIVNSIENNEYIPLNNKNYYVLIKFKATDLRKMHNKLYVKEYNSNIPQKRLNMYTKIDDYTYIFKMNMIMPWGSLLTPSDIQNNLKEFIELKDRSDYISTNFNNTILQKINKSSVKIKLNKFLSLDDEIELIRKSQFSCCFTKNKNTIDYKLLTHLTYGTFCITDSEVTHSFLSDKTCYVDNITEIKEVSEDYFNSFKKNDLFDLIENIMNNHTFVNRVSRILNYFNI